MKAIKQSSVLYLHITEEFQLLVKDEIEHDNLSSLVITRSFMVVREDQPDTVPLFQMRQYGLT